MKKLVYLICFFIILLSGVKVSGNILKILSIQQDNLLAAKSSQSPVFKSHHMLKPVVKLTYGIEANTPFGIEIMPVATATGFSISYDHVSETTLILTNHHFCGEFEDDVGGKFLVQDHEDITKNGSINITQASIVHASEKYDLCLLITDGFIQPATLSFEYERPNEFENIYVVGAPSGNFPIIIDTYISAVIERDYGSIGNMTKNGEGFLLISEIIFAGHSGSPVYSSDGKVIGIVFASMSSYGALAIPIQDIYLFLDEVPPI